MAEDILYKEIENILSENFISLGFRLEEFQVYPFDNGDLGSNLFRFKLNCPCGGVEYVNGCMPDNMDANETRMFCVHVLGYTASRKHLEQDVAEGKLPAMDIDKHCFSGKLIEAA